jgi:hypothetical protein
MIPQHIADFDVLAAEVESRIAGNRGAVEAAAAAQSFHRKSGRKTRVFAVVASSFLLIMFAIGFAAGVNETLHVRRFATEGVATDAKIVRRYMVSVTPRIEYAFSDGAGKRFTRETAMDETAWKDLEGRSTVPIEYLSSDPGWNRLVEGETEAEMFGGKFLFLTGGGLILFGGMLVVSLLGYDLRSENGKMRFVRYGEPVPPPSPASSAPMTDFEPDSCRPRSRPLRLYSPLRRASRRASSRWVRSRSSSACSGCYAVVRRY